MKLYHGFTIETWTASFAGVTLTVGVHAPDYNTPFIFNRESLTESLYVEFYRFDATNDFNHSIFDIPRMTTSLFWSSNPTRAEQCSSASLVPPPARPNPSEDFEVSLSHELPCV